MRTKGKLSRLRAATTVLAGLGVVAWAGTAGAWSYKEAAEPYKGTTVTILDEITPLQEAFAKLVPQFNEETGINVNYQLLNHFEVISRGQADLLSGQGEFDAILLHSAQAGLLLDAGVLAPIDDYLANEKLTSPDIDLADIIEPGWSSSSKYGGKTYAFLTWAYNSIYWARKDLLEHPDEQAAFKAKYGYDLAPAETMQQMRDIAEFFTRKKGEKLAGKALESDFYGMLQEGIKGGSTVPLLWNGIIKNFGGDLFDAEGRPSFDTPEVVAALKFWAELWKFAPPGQAEASLIDVPTIMGQGIVAQTIAWSDFVLGVDRPGASPLTGQFTYRRVPYNGEYKGARSAETEPSILILSKASKNPEATYLFLQWMTDKATQLKLAESMKGAVPMRNSMWNQTVYTDTPLAELFVAMKGSLSDGVAKPRAPKIYELYDAIGGIAQEVGLGTLSPEDGAKKGQELMLAICEKCLLP